MDLKMGDLDGLEATRQLRQNPSTAAIPVIAVTASAFRDARQSALDAGCVDYIPKPVRAEALFAALQTHLGVRFVTEATSSDAAGFAELDPARRHEVARRISTAVGIGDVTALDLLARELAGGSAGESTLGHRLSRLVASFDFDGLREVAAGLARAPGAVDGQ
jgi:DNA-binding response OmpR family regulator